MKGWTGADPTAMTSGMSADRYAFDTNILFYALDARSPQKHRLARRLIERADPDRCIVPLQTLGEVCNTAARKRPDLLPRAQQFVLDTYELFRVVPASTEDLLEALEAHRAHGLQFWDAVLWATARRAGCRLLLSEDLQDGRLLASVLFRNPFTLNEHDFAALL